MTRFLPWYVIVIALLGMAQATANEEIVDARAKFNFQMFCQGCHSANGAGNKSVPELKGFMGHFMTSQTGREYLVRVPGSANSVLNDKELAELLNWMVINFSEGSLPQHWQRFETEEVGRYREDPLMETIKYREQLVQSFKAQQISGK